MELRGLGQLRNRLQEAGVDPSPETVDGSYPSR